jgi:SEC-C motif-containing protein
VFEPCPCGRGASFLACCARLHLGQAEAGSAEALMRARYSAFARRDVDFLLRSWAPETRPAVLELSPLQEWTGLTVGKVEILGPDAARVRFAARYREAGRTGVLRETSRFRREGGRWFYVDGAVR